jgi:hypothetical protein
LRRSLFSHHLNGGDGAGNQSFRPIRRLQHPDLEAELGVLRQLMENSRLPPNNRLPATR